MSNTEQGKAEKHLDKLIVSTKSDIESTHDSLLDMKLDDPLRPSTMQTLRSLQVRLNLYVSHRERIRAGTANIESARRRLNDAIEAHDQLARDIAAHSAGDVRGTAPRNTIEYARGNVRHAEKDLDRRQRDLASAISQASSLR